jgi:hypothetical protein
MADNSSRTFRRDAAPAKRDTSDPLAELARLIGQSDAQRGSGRNAARQPETYDDPAPALDWSAAHDDDYDQYGQADEPYPPQPADETWSSEQAYEEEPPATQRYVRPPVGHDEAAGDPRRNTGRRAAQFDGGSRSGSLPYIPPGQGGYLADQHAQYADHSQAGDEGHAHDQYDEEDASPPRRSGTMIMVAVLGVAVLGTAGALGYRAMFGGSVIPSLPPIIKPSNTPIKIVPQHDAQTGSTSQTDAGQKGTGDQLVNHEEQPVDVQSVNPAPHMVTTIPVISNSTDAPLPDGGPAGSADQGAPPAPPPTFGDANSPPQQFGVATPDAPAQPAPQAQPPASRSVHTLTILPQQQSAAPQEAPAQPRETHAANVRRPATRPTGEARTASAGPLSLVPGQDGGALPPPPRAPRTTSTRGAGPMALTTASTEPAGASPARGGAYAVQVTSQRSEAEAEAAFRSLQAKYPQQLGSRRAFVRRADLGAKGIYYRALVGPFATGEEAVSLCSSLKAAGGSCLIQRNE